MTESTAMQNVRRLAEEIGAKLLATDSRFDGSVHLVHDDGSAFFFSHAFVTKHTRKIPPQELKTWMTSDNEEWLVVFTEHHGIHIFAGDEVLSVRRSSAIYGVIEPLTK